MDAYYKYLNSLVNKNKQEFGNYEGIQWINPWNAEMHEKNRTQLMDAIGNKSMFKETKPFYNHISEGCSICGNGKWSCLFITGRCNANCFYCPAPQNTDDQPSSQGLTFETPEAYAEYINHFDFRGVSFSGGEPLLVQEKVIQYLQAIRSHCNPEIYVWMYTNGILANQEIFHHLAKEGLNEVRFDIGATNYKLSGIEKAQNTVPVLTVEIPAIPEEKERIKELLPKLIDLGVINLNLHQLRLTHHNAEHLLKRNYTYIPAERPIVLESEMAALEIIKHAKEQNMDIGINYCSFFFKYRMQKAGFRKTISKKLMRTGDFLTDKGFLRLRNGGQIQYDGLQLHDDLNPIATVPSDELKLRHKKYKITRSLAKHVKIDDRYQPAVTDLLEKEPIQIPDNQELFDIWQHEFIERGLRML